MGNPVDVIQIESPRLSSEEALGQRRAPFEEYVLSKPGLLAENFMNLPGQESGLIEFPFGLSPAIEGNRDEKVIAGKRRTAREKKALLPVKNSQEVAAPLEFDLMKKILYRAFIPEERPPFIPPGEGNSDPFFRRGEPELLNLSFAGQTKAFFLKFEELVAGRAMVGVKQSEKGLPVKGKGI